MPPPSTNNNNSPFPNRYGPRRKNGLSPPYSKAQVVTWFAWPLLVIQFFMLASPNLPVAASIPVSLVFGIVALAVVYFAYQTIHVDPMDVHLAKHLSAQQQQQQHEQQEHNNKNHATTANGDNNHRHGTATATAACGRHTHSLPSEPMKQCWICDTQVAEHSMHCKFCNKCVSHFDHHCMWLNTCIGDINYKSFFQTMIWITVMLTIHFTVQCALFIALVVERSQHESDAAIRHRADRWFHPASSSNFHNSNATLVALTVLWMIFCVIDIMGLILIVQLLTFHIHLQRKKLSTYLYIVQENQRKREVIRKAGLRRAKRIDAMAQARQEGRTLRATQLRIGGYAIVSKYCSWCDPLPPDEEEEELEFGTMPKNSSGNNFRSPSPQTDHNNINRNNNNNNSNNIGFFSKNQTPTSIQSTPTTTTTSNGGGGGGGVSFIPVEKSPNGELKATEPPTVDSSDDPHGAEDDDNDNNHDDDDDNQDTAAAAPASSATLT